MHKISNYFANAVKNYALKNWRLYSFKQEWLSVIILVLLVKIVTSCISVFSGFYYLDSIFFGLFDSECISKLFSVLALIMLEGLTALFLSKFFKFLLRFNNLKWVFPLLFSFGLFSLSFVISCNGIAIFTAGKVDLTKNIESKYYSEFQSINEDYKSQTLIIKEQIDNIKKNPTDWKDGKRCVLSKIQLDEINKCYDKISELTKHRDDLIKQSENRKKNEIRENTTNTANEAEKFYKYVAAIMFIQLTASFALMFFWSKISGEDDPESNQVEAVEKGLKKIEETVDGCIGARVDTKLNILKTIYTEIATESDRRKVAAVKKQTEIKPLKVVGFDTFNDNENVLKTTQNNTPENATTHGVSAVKSVNLTPSDSVFPVAVCAECGNALNASQIARKARFCCPSCRVRNYNKMHPEKKNIILKPDNFKH